VTILFTQPVIVQATGGTVDTNSGTTRFSGNISGAGGLTASGGGILVLTGTNTQAGGVTISGATLQITGDGNLGAPSAPLTFNSGTLQPTDSVTLARPIVIQVTGATIDTGGNTVTLTGVITNAGNLLFTGNGQVVLTGTLSGGGIEVFDGQLALDGNITPTFVKVDIAGLLRGLGTIGGTTTVEGTLEPGGSPGTLNFTAPVIMQKGSTLVLDIDGTGTGTGAGNYSRVIVRGGNSFDAAGTLAPKLRNIAYAATETPGTNSYSPPLGQRFAGVVQADGGILGSFAGLTQPAGLLAGTRFDAVYQPTTLDLYVTPASYGNLAVAGVGQTRNQAAVGGALDALRPAAGTLATGDIKTLFDALAPLNAGTLPGTLGRLAGQLHPELPATAVEVGRSLGGALSGRFDQLHGDTLAERAQAGLTGIAFGFEGGQTRGGGGPVSGLAGGGDGPASPDAWSAWARAFGAFTNNGGDGNNPGFQRTTGGGLAGADREVARDLRGGLDLGYAHGDLTAREGGGTASADSYRLGLYASWTPGTAFTPVPLFVDTGFGGGLDRFGTQRTVALGSLGGTASGGTTSHDGDAELAIGIRLSLGGFTVEPSTDLRYDLAAVSGYSETGAGLLGLSVAGATHDALQTGLGVRVTHSYTLDSGLILEPDLKLRGEHEILDPRYATSERLGGAPFSVTASNPGRDALVAGGGIAAALDTNLKLYLRYDAEVRPNETGQSLTGGFRYGW